MNEELMMRLERHSQAHLLQFLPELDQGGREALTAEIEELDLVELESLIAKYVSSRYEPPVPAKIEPAPYFPAEPENPSQAELYSKAEGKGRQLISHGKVAALTVAGGQGSRLGFEGPKGSYPITPVKGKTLFQYFSESLARASDKFNCIIPWYIMTSKTNHEDTVNFFRANAFFGLDPKNVAFFSQGTMPAISCDGKILLQSKGHLALAPNGHGGTILALKKSGSLDDMQRRGIEFISYFQVDNPLVSVVNPLFIGLHCLEGADISTRALIKTGPHEKLGNFCIADGKIMIIEYSDMPKELAESTDDAGRLKFRAGSPAIHVLSRDFVDRLTRQGEFRLPWHRADKKVPFIDQSGNLVKPDSPNAVKLETFIFDAIPLARKSIILEARREDEFAPVKNQSGQDSAESCREMLVARDARWLESAGISVPRSHDGRPSAKIELSPRSFLDESDAISRFKNKKFTIHPDEEVYFE